MRDGDRALLLDMGSGARRLLADLSLLEGAKELHIVLTHFHFDHLCGLPYLPRLRIDATIWAPGRWLYRQESVEILEPLRCPPIAPSDVTTRYPIYELTPGQQSIGGFDMQVSAQPRHWAPSVGLRIDDYLAFITDTPYEPTSSELASGVVHLLHEAWSSSHASIHPDQDATAADAARVAREAGVKHLTLTHLNPALDDLSALLDDAKAHFERVVLAEDDMRLSVERR